MLQTKPVCPGQNFEGQGFGDLTFFSTRVCPASVSQVDSTTYWMSRKYLLVFLGQQ